MWMIELAMNTITAESRIGSDRDMIGTMRTSLVLELQTECFPVEQLTGVGLASRRVLVVANDVAAVEEQSGMPRVEVGEQALEGSVLRGGEADQMPGHPRVPGLA